MIQITPLSFEEIFPVWKNELWPGRESAITPCSAISSVGTIDMSLLHQQPYFWGCRIDDILCGVISGFQTSETEFRSRGIWVHEKMRGLKIGSKLIAEVANQAVSLGCKKVWTMPRSSSWGFYQRNGFYLTGESNAFEFGPHYFAEKELVVYDAK